MNEHLEQEASKARARERQRRYRLRRRRIDYFPDQHAVTTIDLLRTGYAGGDASSIINKVIADWAASRAKSNAPAATLARSRADWWNDR